MNIKTIILKELRGWIPKSKKIQIPEIQIGYCINESTETVKIDYYDLDGNHMIETRDAEPGRLLQDVLNQDTTNLDILSTSVYGMIHDNSEMYRERIENMTQKMIHGDNIADWIWGHYIEWQCISHSYNPEIILSIANETKRMQKNVPTQDKIRLEPLDVQVENQIELRKKINEYNQKRLSEIENSKSINEHDKANAEYLKREIDKDKVLLSGQPAFFAPYNGRTLEEFLRDDLPAFYEHNRRINEQGEYYGPYSVFNQNESSKKVNSYEIANASFMEYNDLVEMAIKYAKSKNLRAEKCIYCEYVILVNPRRYSTVACPRCEGRHKMEKNTLSQRNSRNSKVTDQIYNTTLKYIREHIKKAVCDEERELLQRLKDDFCDNSKLIKNNYDKYSDACKQIRMKIYEVITSYEEGEKLA